jgi:sphingolipid delta-4 desaturase|mmetsp:Transcript_99665/g.157752  ORF Transcript_99665/g.157752 Transcript_99665/m.157752 type:complete len:330 (+) Transcript_99665:83-1072(+)
MGWSASAPKDFIVSDGPEPHAVRKGQILKAHPEIKDLMGYEWRTKYMVAATVALQVFMAWLTLEWRWPAYLAAIYIVGATANHSLFLAIHEISHSLGAQSIAANKVLAMLANVPIGIPYCITFKPYHMEHHRMQGHDGKDTDIPSYLECYVITDTALGYLDHTFRKAFFMFSQIFAYALRPMSIKPEMVPYGDPFLYMNWTVQIIFDGTMVYFFGPKVMLWFLYSTFFAGSIHPTAGHFLAEHYVMEGETETYSYYGPLNYLTYNVGFHNEHHDFPNIAWSNLPKVRKIAPEFYDHLPQCKSWSGVIFRYIFDNSISPYSRVKRNCKQA